MSSTAALPYSFYDDGNVSLPIYNGRSPPINGGDGSNVLKISPKTVGLGSTLTLLIWPD